MRRVLTVQVDRVKSRPARSLRESCKIERLEKTLRHETIHSFSDSGFVLKWMWIPGSRGTYTNHTYRFSDSDRYLHPAHSNTDCDAHDDAASPDPGSKNDR